jgi:hypothetical protein
MSDDFYSLELRVRERIGSKYQEAEAHRLANTVTRSSPTHHNSLRTIAGQAHEKVTRVVRAVIHRRKHRPSPATR